MLALACLLSGCAALVYQILWTRQIGLVMGTTVEAVATVVATFMGGLAAGSALAARFVDGRGRSQLARLYAALECGIAGLALLVPVAIRAAQPLLASLYDSDDPAAASLTLARFGSSVLVLLPPTILMGATLPTLVALASPSPGRVGTTSGFLYAVNASGAVVGTLGCALVLLPQFGMHMASFVAVALNLAAAAMAYGFGRRHETAAAAPAGPQPAREERRRKKKKGERMAATATAPLQPLPLALPLAVAALTGFAGLANEVAWTRALILLIGPTSYAFAFILTAVIAGIAIGSALCSWLLPRLRGPAFTLFAVLTAGALLGILVTHAIGTSVVEVGEFVRRNVDDMNRLLRGQLQFVLALLVPPAALSGAAFPLCARLASERVAGAARPVGLVLAGNTAGAIAGALAAGFWLMPRLGLERTLLAVVGVQLATAILVIFFARRPLLGRLATAALALALFGFFLQRRVPWDVELLAGGVYKYAAYAGEASIEDTVRAGELLYYKEGRAATVSVKRLGGTLSLAVDGKVDATSSGDMLTQRLLAHVPLLLHRNPKTALVIGLGSGVTAGAALSHPLDRVDAVEISAEVVEAARRFFTRANKEAISDRRLRLIVSDGRNHVELAGLRYDVVISEPSNPWMAGVSALFTRDFFLKARTRLNPGGLFCQWAHVYNMSERDLKTVIASFADAFPAAVLFLINEGDVLLVGGPAEGPSFDKDTLARRMSEGRVAEDLAEVHVQSAFAFASLLTLPNPTLLRYAAGADRHTDDRPVLEFRTPRSIHANTGRQNAMSLVEAGHNSALPEPWQSLVRAPTAAQLAERALMLERSEGFFWAYQVYAEAIAKDPSLLPALEGLVRCAVRSGRVADAERTLVALAEKAAPVESGVALALLYDNTGRAQDAITSLEAALAREPRHRRALLLSAELQEQAGNFEAVAALVGVALRNFPGDAEAEAFLGSLSLAKQDLDAAIATADRVLERAPKEARALEVAAIARAQKGDRAGARPFFERLVEAEPDAWGHLNNFALFELEGRDYRAAARLFETSLDLNPANETGARGLAEAARALGEARLLRRALSRAPRSQTRIPRP